MGGPQLAAELFEKGLPLQGPRPGTRSLRHLSPQSPIILLTKELVVPDQTLNLVDALVVTDRLGSQLLPTIAHLRGCARIPQPSYNA